MRKAIDLTGKRFGRLTVIKRVENDKWGHSRWLCECDCGNIKETSGDNLMRGICNSCGCIQKEVTIARSTVHNLHHTRIYSIWEGMKSRCKDTEIKNYGGRGIKVCEEWLEFKPFYDWALANGYKDNLTIDRIDVNGNYEPLNCRWSNRIEQANNTRFNRKITYKGKTHTVAEWSRIKGINMYTIYNRLHKGWDEEEAITTPASMHNPKKKRRKI